MKVLYLISVRGHGRGGHFHSLNHIASTIGENIEVGIYSVGLKKSEVISKNLYFNDHYFFNGINFFAFKKKIKKDIEVFNADIIHCFDNAAYNLISLVLGSRSKIVVNKCGGPNPIKFPFVQNIILFSKENQVWFKNQSKFESSSVYLIPNRVDRRELVIANNYRPVSKENAFCFVRIARIGKAYKKSFEDSISVVEKLKIEGFNVHLYIIGAVEDEVILMDLIDRCVGLPVTFLTENDFTKKASNMLYLADAVIATGRGIMEATGLDIPILTPAQNSDHPILVTNDNFETFLATNFSQRNVASEDDLKANFAAICRLIDDEQFYKDCRKKSTIFFSNYFDVRGAVAKYIEVYENIIKNPNTDDRRFDNYNYQAKTIFTFFQKWITTLCRF